MLFGVSRPLEGTVSLQMTRFFCYSLTSYMRLTPSRLEIVCIYFFLIFITIFFYSSVLSTDGLRLLWSLLKFPNPEV